MQKKNIDPEIDLKDEDEEPALPEPGDDTDGPAAAAVAGAGAGAGHNVIMEFARHAPWRPASTA